MCFKDHLPKEMRLETYRMLSRKEHSEFRFWAVSKVDSEVLYLQGKWVGWLLARNSLGHLEVRVPTAEYLGVPHQRQGDSAAVQTGKPRCRAAKSCSQSFAGCEWPPDGNFSPSSCSLSPPGCAYSKQLEWKPHVSTNQPAISQFPGVWLWEVCCTCWEQSFPFSPRWLVFSSPNHIAASTSSSTENGTKHKKAKNNAIED